MCQAARADTPRQQQIEQEIAYFKNLREHQLQIKSAIAELAVGIANLKQTNQDYLPNNSKKEKL